MYEIAGIAIKELARSEFNRGYSKGKSLGFISGICFTVAASMFYKACTDTKPEKSVSVDKKTELKNKISDAAYNTWKKIRQMGDEQILLYLGIVILILIVLVCMSYVIKISKKKKTENQIADAIIFIRNLQMKTIVDSAIKASGAILDCTFDDFNRCYRYTLSQDSPLSFTQFNTFLQQELLRNHQHLYFYVDEVSSDYPIFVFYDELD